MAMSCVIRKASPTVVPLAIRAISSPRINFTGSLPNAIISSDYNYKIGISNYSELKESSFLSNQFSTSAAAAVDDYNNVDHKKFVKVLRSEIKLAKRLDSKKRVLSTPTGFPFIIQDKPGNDSITLERILHGEKIEVTVEMPSVIKEDKEEGLDCDVISSDDDSDDVSDNDSPSTMTDEEDEEISITNPAPTIPMFLQFTVGNGDILKFRILASSDEITIEKMRITKEGQSSYEFIEGPEFETLASDVQYCLKKFLKNIGIEESNVEFLYKYMIRKSKRNDMLWMEELKKFVKMFIKK